MSPQKKAFRGIPEGWTGVDMHVHSRHSDAFPVIDTILERAKRRGIGVAITDHNTIAGSIEAYEKAKGDTLVIPAIEVSSEENVHLLLYFAVPSDLESFFLRAIEPHTRKRLFCKSIALPEAEILAAAKEFGALRVLAHPFGNGRFHMVAEETRALVLSLIDGIEICNGAQPRRRNNRAYALACQTHCCSVGGSDAHVAGACGHVCTFAPGNDAPTFLHSLRKGVSTVVAYPYSLREALEDGAAITCRYLWHALHRHPVWT